MEMNSLLLTVTLLSLLNVGTLLDIDAVDGGYIDVVVSISKNVPYNESVIKDIKSSAEFLHQATNGLVYFKHVIIDVPHTWPSGGRFRHVSSRGYEKSDVRVGPPVPPYGDRPFTKQVRACGDPGEFIHITPDFLGEVRATSPRRYKNPAYTFVHEWAHFRYGVFDEYGCPGDDQFPLTYCSINGQVKLNSCSARMRFTATLPNGANCSIKKNCQFTDDCKIDVFQPSDTLVESSIMFMPYLANVTQFCEAGTGDREHNPYAPNKQNYMCKGKSTWEVIAGNEDFKGLPQADMAKQISVSFEERIRDLPQRVVLVLDVSQSMSVSVVRAKDIFEGAERDSCKLKLLNEGRLGFLKEATSRYIRDIPEGSLRLAIVTFSGTANIAYNLTTVNSASREGFLNVVRRLKHISWTCIGCGLQLALQVLNTTKEGPEGAIVVLMSDGNENQLPYVKHVLESVVNASVEVTTLALGPTADNSLEDLALATGGRSYAFADLRGGVALDMCQAFVQSTTAQIDSGLRPVLVTRTEQNISTVSEILFTLDTTVGNNTVVDIEHKSSAIFTAWLVDPKCNRCDTCNQRYANTISSFSIPGQAMAGIWTLHVESSTRGNLSVNVQVKSEARNASDEPIRLSCKVDTPVVNTSCQAKIYADVTKGSKVVLDAEVFAEVIGPIPPHKSTVRLHDDGHDPDVHRNDGTYSGYFTGFTGPGRYSVMCHVSSQNTTRLSYPACGSGSSFATMELSPSDGSGPLPTAEYLFSDFALADNSAEATNAASLAGEAVGPLQRSATAGAFRVTTNLIEKDVPPGDIRDLSVTEVRRGANDTFLAQLTWTWPGAHLTNGQASAVVIRVSNNSDALLSDFEKQAEITEACVLDGDLSPLPSGSKHNVAVSLPTSVVLPQGDASSDWTAYLAARVTNSEGLHSEMSNIARMFEAPVPEVTSPTRDLPHSRWTVLSLWMWTVVAVVALFIVIIVVTVVLTFLKKPGRKAMYPVRRLHGPSKPDNTAFPSPSLLL